MIKNIIFHGVLLIKSSVTIRMQSFDYVSTEKIKSSIRTGIFSFINIDVLSLCSYLSFVAGMLNSGEQPLNT